MIFSGDTPRYCMNTKHKHISHTKKRRPEAVIILLIMLLGLNIAIRFALDTGSPPVKIEPQTDRFDFGVIDINTATETDLCLLPGIGPVTARLIIDYRNNHGRFSTAEELMNIKGLGRKTFDRISGLVRVSR